MFYKYFCRASETHLIVGVGFEKPHQHRAHSALECKITYRASGVGFEKPHQHRAHLAIECKITYRASREHPRRAEIKP
jgi:hypothetical protein